MEKWLYGPMGPIKGGGGSPPWAWRQGWGPSPPRPAHPPPLGSLVPHGGGEEDGTPPWPIQGGVHPPFSIQQHIFLFLLLLPGSGLPLFGVCAWIGFLHHRQAVALLESGSEAVFLPLLAWF